MRDTREDRFQNLLVSQLKKLICNCCCYFIIIVIFLYPIKDTLFIICFLVIVIVVVFIRTTIDLFISSLPNKKQKINILKIDTEV